MFRCHFGIYCLLTVLQASVEAIHSSPLGPRPMTAAFAPHEQSTFHPQRASLSFPSSVGTSSASTSNAPLPFSQLRQSRAKVFGSVATPPAPEDGDGDNDRSDARNTAHAGKGKGKAKSRIPRLPIKTRFATKLTFIPVPLTADYITREGDSRIVNAEDEVYRDAVWIDATNVGAAYHAPNAAAELKMHSVFSGIAMLRAHEGEEFRWPMMVKEEDLRPQGMKKSHPDFPDMAPEFDGGNSTVAENAKMGYETTSDFAARLWLLLTRIVGREALEATLLKGVYEMRQLERHNKKPDTPASSPDKAKKMLRIPDALYHDGMYLATGDRRIESETPYESERPVIPLVHESSVVIVADETVLQMLMRGLLQMARWRRNDITRLIDQRNEPHKPFQPTYRQPIQFLVDHIDELPLRNGRLFGKKMREDRQALDVTLMTWPFNE